MDCVEERLKNLILSKYKSVREFTNFIGMPYSTFDSILKRGISNSNITNVLMISNALGIDTEKLADGEIAAKQSSIETIAAHKNAAWTDEELNKIEEYKKLLLAARPQKGDDYT